MTKKIVKFGKYRGKDVKHLLADKNYVNWLMQQEWFPDKYQWIYNLINNPVSGEESEEDKSMTSNVESDKESKKEHKSLTPLGALDKETGEYVYPKIADKKGNYMCADCKRDVIVCKGSIRVHHFRHKKDSNGSCEYYDHPNESQIHKDAKLLLKRILDDKKQVSLVRKCCKCNKNEIYEIPEVDKDSDVCVEYRFEYNGTKIADVAYLNNKKIKYIFEICNTHRTDEEHRPEPWFELEAKTLIDIVNNSDDTVDLFCMRPYSDLCKSCIKRKEERMKNIELKCNKLLYSVLNATSSNRRYEILREYIQNNFGLLNYADKYVFKEIYSKFCVATRNKIPEGLITDVYLGFNPYSYYNNNPIFRHKMINRRGKHFSIKYLNRYYPLSIKLLSGKVTETYKY